MVLLEDRRNKVRSACRCPRWRWWWSEHCCRCHAGRLEAGLATDTSARQVKLFGNHLTRICTHLCNGTWIIRSNDTRVILSGRLFDRSDKPRVGSKGEHISDPCSNGGCQYRCHLLLVASSRPPISLTRTSWSRVVCVSSAEKLNLIEECIPPSVKREQEKGCECATWPKSVTVASEWHL